MKLSVIACLSCFFAVSFFWAEEGKPTVGAAEEYYDSPHRVMVNSQIRKQYITHWGHDIKQPGKAVFLTEDASRQIFEHGRFNVLRIPFFATSHNADGSLKTDYHVRLAPLVPQEMDTLWEVIPTGEEDWFHLRNVAFDQHLRAFPPGSKSPGADNTLEIDSTSQVGSWTQWRLVEAGNNWYHIESRGHRRYLRSNSEGDVHLVDRESTGTWTQWRLIKEGGYHRILRRGSSLYLKGGGSAYDVTIAAVRNAASNGNPALFASHKLQDNSDMNTSRNTNFGPFFTEGGIDAAGYAAALEVFMAMIEVETGQPVTYLAPRCELGRHWTPESYVAVVNHLTNPPLIVGPEAAYTVNSETFFTSEVAAVTDVKATHNKENSPLWPMGAIYDWDAETVGGNGDNFSNLVFKLHEAIYIGEVHGIVFWGSTHLLNHDQDGRNGPFRRDLVAASEFPLIDVGLATGPERTVIAFETGDRNSVRVFYTASSRIELAFDRPLLPESIPAEAFNVTETTFELPLTGHLDYRMFIVSFQQELLPESTFEGWRLRRFSETELSDDSVSGRWAAPAGDGIPNLLKFALGLEPDEFARGGLPETETWVDEEEEYLATVFTRPKGREGIAYFVDASADLVDWADRGILVNSEEKDGGEWVTETYRDVVPMRGLGGRFMRLRIAETTE